MPSDIADRTQRSTLEVNSWTRCGFWWHGPDMTGDIRPGEVFTALPETTDAGLYFVGRVRTPWTDRRDCPRGGDMNAGPVCTLEIDPRWLQALTGLDKHSHLQVLYWMHLSRRDLTIQAPRHSAAGPVGTFALRSPVRPNPIASSIAVLVGVEGNLVHVRGLDCLDGTPLVDLKPWRWPVAKEA